MRNILYWDFRNLEDSEASLEEVVKSGAGSLRTKFATEELEKRFTRVKRVDEEEMAPACRGGRRWRWRERGGRAGRRWRRWSPRGTWPSRPWLSSICEKTTEVVEDQFWVVFTYFVTLKALKRRIHLITERPTGGTTWQNSFKGGKQKCENKQKLFWHRPQIWRACILGWSCRRQRSQIYWKVRPCSPARGEVNWKHYLQTKLSIIQ